MLLPYVLIQGSHYTATAAGAALVPFALILTVLSPIMGGVAGRIGARLPLTVGPIVVGAGFPPGYADWRRLLDRHPAGHRGDVHRHGGRGGAR